MRRVLSLRDFRLLWLSQAVSTFGDRMVLVVLALYVNDIGTPTDVGLVLAAQGGGFVALLLIGGVWADRLPRHLVMVGTDLLRAGLHAALAVLILSGEPSIATIAIIEAAFGAGEAFFRPAYTGLIPQTVPDALIAEAQAVSKITENVADFGGPAVGSALFLAAGAGAAFAFDAATFVLSALLLVRVRPRARAAPAPRERLLTELAGGWRELRARPWAALTILGACLAVVLAIAPLEALGPAVADAGYDEAAVYGALVACFGIGSLAGSVLATLGRPRRYALAWLSWSGFTIVLVLFALGVPLAALLPVALVAGVGVGAFDVWWETSLAVSIPPGALSRVSAWDWMGSLALLPFGFLLAGPIGEALGEPETLLGGAALAIGVQIAIAVALAHPNSGTPDSVVEASA